MLIASASEEALTDPSAAARIASRLPAARHLCVEGALHEILMETDERRAVWLSAFDQLCADNHI
jgi:lysophospholipase